MHNDLLNLLELAIIFLYYDFFQSITLDLKKSIYLLLRQLSHHYLTRNKIYDFLFFRLIYYKDTPSLYKQYVVILLQLITFISFCNSHLIQVQIHRRINLKLFLQAANLLIEI